MGSGGAPKKAGSTSEGPSHPTGSSSEGPSSTAGSGSHHELQPSTFEDPPSAHPAASGTHLAKPSATAASAGNAAVGAATRLSHSEPPQSGDISSGTPTAATFTNPAPQAGSGSSALPLLLVIVLGLLLGYAGVRLRHHHLRRRLEAFRHRQDVAWEEAVRQIEMERAVDTAKPSVEPLQKIGAG